MRARVLVVAGALALLACIVLLLRTGGEDASPSPGPGAPHDATGPGAQPAGGEAQVPVPRDPWQPGVPPSEPSPLHADAGAIVFQRVAEGLVVHEPAVRVRLEGSADDGPYRAVPASRRFDDLPPGTYAIELSGNGWLADPASVPLASGEEAHVQLRPATLCSGLVLAGPRARPLDRASLRLEAFAPPEGERSFDVSAMLFEGEVALEHGAFRLVGFDIPPSSVTFRSLRLLASAPGWFEAAAPDAPLTDSLQATGLVVVLPGAVLAGRVLVPDGAGGHMPGVGAVVQVVAPETDPSHVAVADGLPQVVDAQLRNVPPQAQAITDARGEFLVPPLADGARVRHVRLLASANGCRPLLSEPFELDQLAEPVAERELVLQAGARLHGTLRVRLVQPNLAANAADPADAADTDDSADTAALPAVAAPRHIMLRRLEATGPAPGVGQAITPRSIPAPASDPGVAHWEFDASGLEPGPWLVTAQLDLPTGADLPPLAPQSLVQTVTLAEGRRTDVTFTFPVEHGATVHGSVRLPEGLDLALAEVGIAPSGPWQQPLAGAPLRADGRFEVGGVPPGQHALFAFARSRDHATLAVTSQPLVVDADPVPARHLDASRPEVRITVAEPLRPRRLLLSGQTGDASFDTWLAMGRAWITAGADGTARVFGLLPGSYRLTAEGQPPHVVGFDVLPGREVVHVDVR
jgi:hypothetical protein